jgi:hypothetical protein
MTLAGSIRLRTFLLVAGSLGALGAAGGGWALYEWSERNAAERAKAEADAIMAIENRRQEALRAEQAKLDAAPPTPPRPDAALAGVRSFDAPLAAMLGKPLGTDKKKDVFPGGPKVNVYQDAGNPVAHRAKVDLDRDEHDDEKWSFQDGKITRQVSPKDDDTYPETYLWDGKGWQRTDAGAPAAKPTTPLAPGARPVDAALMTWRGKAIGSDKLKDVTQGQPYKINVYQDAGSTTANRAKIDLDRDDKWDEKITFQADGVLREVAPADDEVYTKTYLWKDGAWVAK